MAKSFQQPHYLSILCIKTTNLWLLQLEKWCLILGQTQNLQQNKVVDAYDKKKIVLNYSYGQKQLYLWSISGSMIEIR